jgi:DNA polymerase-3 subunit alpha
MKFVNLHHHTSFSFGDGFGMPNQHVARAAELGYSAIAFTEHGNISSHFQAEKAALKTGIKPIFGVEAYCGAVGEDKQQFKFHLTILAANNEGYRNLNRIVTQSYRDFHYHPTVSGASLHDNSAGLVVLSGCSGSLLACTLTGGKGIPDPGGVNLISARRVIESFKRTFGDRYFLEIQPFPELDHSEAINGSYAWLSKQTGVPLVVTHDVHYPKYEDHEMQAVLHAVHRGKASVDDAMREWNYEVPMTLPDSDNELYDRLRQTGLNRQDSIDAIINSAAISDTLNVTLPKAERLRYPATEEDLAPWR